jgi:hypothetical protein
MFGWPRTPGPRFDASGQSEMDRTKATKWLCYHTTRIPRVPS